MQFVGEWISWHMFLFAICMRFSGGPVDTTAKIFTLARMGVLLQIRVQNQVAKNFKQAAKRRGKTARAYLRQVVERAIIPQKSSPQNRDARRTALRNANRLSYNLVSRLRAEDDE